MRAGLSLAGLAFLATTVIGPAAASAAVDFPPLRDPYLSAGAPPHRCQQVPRAEREKLGFPLQCPASDARRDTGGDDRTLSRGATQLAVRPPARRTQLSSGGDRFA